MMWRDPFIVFNALVLNQLLNLSGAGYEPLFNDRYLLEKFAGLVLTNAAFGAIATVFLCERLSKAWVSAKDFERSQPGYTFLLTGKIDRLKKSFGCSIKAAMPQLNFKLLVII